MIYNETDLIQKHRPSSEEGDNATLDAVEQIDRILKRPKAFSGIFSDENYLKKWKDKKQQIFTLFREKYTNYWGDFCIDHKIGRKSRHGLMLSRDVANIYKTILAQCVSDSRGVSPITDDRQLDRFSIFSRKATPNISNEETTIDAAQGIINLKLPGNLQEIA